MNHEDPSKKRKTIKIHLQPKPAAPRHPHTMARAISLAASINPSQRKHSPFLFPIIQVGIASILSAMVLDEGECSHVVAYAALGYLGGLLMMVPRRDALTSVDESLIRWGFVILFFISSIIATVIWPIRMHGM